MRRPVRPVAGGGVTLGLIPLGLVTLVWPHPAQAQVETAEEVVARHLEARGGADRWRQATSVELDGTYAAFSERSPFQMVWLQGDLYRLDFELLGGPAVRARDAQGPWWQHALLQAEPARLTEGPYKTQLEREASFGPLLLDYQSKGYTVELLGPGDVDGVPTIDLRVVLADGQEETWFLDAGTYLEVAIDSQVFDHTQSNAPMRQRAFFDDFRAVDGLVLPFQVDYEFGARLETMTVREARVGGAVDSARLAPPETSTEEPASEEGPAE